MKIKTTRVPFRMGNFTCRLHDIRVRCRFGTRLLIYFVLLIFIGPYFGNWTTTEKFLCRLDVYANECTFNERLGEATDAFRCSAQRFSIAKLGSICRVSVLTVGFFLGLLLDILGPKLTFLIGILMRMCSWLIFSIRSPPNSLIIFSSVILGLSRNAIAYPTLTIYMYTTSFKEYATTIMGIGITLAGLYIIVIERLMGFTQADPYKFTLYSMLVTHVPCMLTGLLIFPWKAPTPKIKLTKGNLLNNAEADQSTDDDNKFNVETSSSNESSHDVISTAQTTFTKTTTKNTTNTTTSSTTTNSSGGSGREANLLDNYTKLPTNNKLANSNTSGNGNELKTLGQDRTIIIFDKNDFNEEESQSDVQVDGDVQVPIDHSNWNLSKFLKYLRSLDYLVTCPYFVLNFLDFFFMQMMFSTMYGRYNDVMTLNEYLVSFSFILTFFIGFLYKIFNPVTILIFSNSFGILTHFITFSSSRLAGYLAASTLIAYSSILFTQTYIYIQSTFDAKYFGSLIGTINTFSGLIMFLNILLISLVQRFNCINSIHVALIIARSTSQFFLILLNMRRRKRTKSI